MNTDEAATQLLAELDAKLSAERASKTAEQLAAERKEKDRCNARNRRKRARKAFQKKLEADAKPQRPFTHARRRARKQAALLRQAGVRRKGLGRGSRGMGRARNALRALRTQVVTR